MQTTLFQPAKQEPVVVQRNTDILTTIEVIDSSQITANEVSAMAAKQKDVPQYKPDGAGATLIFHTKSGKFILGGVRNNPALEKVSPDDNAAFPQQINSTIGGYLAKPELSLKESLVEAVKNKMLLQEDLKEHESGFDSQQIIKDLLKSIESQQGWEGKICIHTDKWQNDNNTEGTMCFLTAIKHIQCRDEDLNKIEESLQSMMRVKKEKGANLRALSDFKFVPLQPLIDNSLETYSESEVNKAKNAYQKFGNKIAVTFNDLAVATLAKNGAFSSNESVELTLPSARQSTRYGAFQ